MRQRCASFQLLSPSTALGCRGYIGALVDIFSDGKEIYGLRACIGPDEKREAVVKVVQAWLDRHPESLGKKASLLTAQALAEAYPCALE